MTPTLSPAAAGAAQCALLLLAPPALLRGSLLPEAPTLPWGLRSPQAAKGTPSHLPAAYASCATRCAWFGHARSGCKRRARGFPRTGPHASCARPNGRRSQPAASARRCATASGARAGPAAWSVVPRLRRPRPRPRRRPWRPWPGSRRRARTPARCPRRRTPARRRQTPRWPWSCWTPRPRRRRAAPCRLRSLWGARPARRPGHAAPAPCRSIAPPKGGEDSRSGRCRVNVSQFRFVLVTQGLCCVLEAATYGT